VKKIYLIALLVLATAWILRAQTNAPNTNAVAEILALVTTNAPAPKPAQTNAPTQIDSDKADFDLKGRQAVYEGHVRVDSPQTKLACVQLTVNLPQTGGHINHIVAETNVVIDHTDEKGATNHITCGMAIYDYNVQGAVTNETITFTNSPQIVTPQYTNTADVIIWYRADGHLKESNYQMIPRHDATTNTNSGAANTNSFLMPNLF
jgi:lipopolysaccharide export system protein LptA